MIVFVNAVSKKLNGNKDTRLIILIKNTNINLHLLIQIKKLIVKNAVKVSQSKLFGFALLLAFAP
jgi:hypothetical protein